MHDRTVIHCNGGSPPDPAREARARLAGRSRRRLGRQALARAAQWRRRVLGAMVSGLAVLVALQFGPTGTGRLPSIHDQMRNKMNTLNPGLPRIFVSSTDFARLMARLNALPAAEADRLQGLAGELERADVRAPGDMPPGVVAMGSIVRFALDTSADLTLTLVYPDEVDGQPDRISIFAPVGSALLGLPVGARIEWPRPDGATQRIAIKQVGCPQA